MKDRLDTKLNNNNKISSIDSCCKHHAGPPGVSQEKPMQQTSGLNVFAPGVSDKIIIKEEHHRVSSLQVIFKIVILKRLINDY